TNGERRGGTAGAPATATATPGLSPTPSTPAAGDEGTVVAVRIRNGEVDPPPRRVEVEAGTEVRLEVTSDTADEVHVHGYDEELVLTPGGSQILTFVADQPGVFEVETHDSGLQLLQLVVR
ncbi:MAG: cupredoxin domain-containing protein, partial [Actinomycetota bacterium]|nr:cupredoxin domain-containing protein [Actinomycetota bacterium]